MAKKSYTWYVEPLDSRTNEIISRELPEENAERVTLGDKGGICNLWRCQYDFIAYLQKSKATLGLNFHIYNRAGRNGKVRRIPFLPKRIRRVRITKEVKTATS